MKRRSFLQLMGAAPAVILTPGLLMPVRKLWTPVPDPGVVVQGGQVMLDPELFIIERVEVEDVLADLMGVRSRTNLLVRSVDGREARMTISGAGLTFQVGQFLKVTAPSQK